MKELGNWNNGKCPHGHRVETKIVEDGWHQDTAPGCMICKARGWKSIRYRPVEPEKSEPDTFSV